MLITAIFYFIWNRLIYIHLSTAISQPPTSNSVVFRGFFSQANFVDNEAVEVSCRKWSWKGCNIRYNVAGEDNAGSAVLMIHGFGGNADHFRRNTPILGMKFPTYSIDLLGYGYSDKPDPGPWQDKNSIYNFENWADQVKDFIREVIQKPVFLVCNSVGACVGLQAALSSESLSIKGLVILNMSLRMLHTSKQPLLLRPFITALQWILRETSIGSVFFKSVATENAVRNILYQCYGNPDTVTNELIDIILRPGLEAGADRVFLDFISYSGGPLPEDLLPQIVVPVLIAWGDADPWEPVEMGQMYRKFSCVKDFIVLEGVGHCPQCESPELVNPLIENFIQKYT